MKKKYEDIEIIKASETVNEGKKENFFKTAVSSVVSFLKKFKSKKIRNQALFKKGSYSLAITALVIVGLMILNWWLMPTLATRLHLEVDMSERNKNSISEDNIDYIKSVDKDVSVTVCATEKSYSDYMAYLAYEYYGVMYYTQSEYDHLCEYFTQTITLLEKYHEYNKKFDIKYVDPQSTEFTAITSNYPNHPLTYGDILVTSTVDGKERIKVLSFDDIYVLTENQNSYAYNITYSLTANRLETALTSAISYVTSADSKKVAILSGHSNNNYTDAYEELLAINNYDVTEITDKMITSISNEYDAIIISAPTIDFIGSELDVISEYLENDGKMGKGLIFFADATGPELPNLYNFLKQWGIEISDGIIFETDGTNHSASSPSAIGMFPAALEDDDINDSISFAVADYNVPMTACDASTYERTATPLMITSKNVVLAPKGAAADWADYSDDDKTQFHCVIQSVESDIDKDNNQVTSYVMAFSSVEYVQSEWAAYDSYDNQNIVMACTDRASHVGNTSKIFTAKVITDSSYSDSVTASSVKVMIVIFMVLIPVAVITTGIVIFVRRRNAR